MADLRIERIEVFSFGGTNRERRGTFSYGMVFCLSQPISAWPIQVTFWVIFVIFTSLNCFTIRIDSMRQPDHKNGTTS